MPALYKQLMMTVAVEAFQDVYRVVAALTLFAVVPALLLRSVRRARPKDDQSSDSTPRFAPRPRLIYMLAGSQSPSPPDPDTLRFVSVR